MKVALVHDYLNEFGGAEKVLMALSEIWPDAPIYTAFSVRGSSAEREFRGHKVITSWYGKLPFSSLLYSPLRFLIPKIWNSFDLSEYDLIVTSASWYVTKGMKKRDGAFEICYCHTPPRWLYGYKTSINWQKWRIVRAYALVVGHFLRIYDFEQAQKVTVFVANSRNVANRIRKFYRREAEVIYPPVEVEVVDKVKKEDYWLIVSRLVGAKGIEMAIEAAAKYGFTLKIAGETAGFSKLNSFQSSIDGVGGKVELLGRVTEKEKAVLMAKAKGFLALSLDEDFGITPVEAMAVGTPVVAYNGGGYRESVQDGKTGILFSDYSVEGLWEAMKTLEKKKWDADKIKKHAQRFSKERFKREIVELVAKQNISS